MPNNISDKDINIKIANIHSVLKINGDFSRELVEQKMVVRYFTGNEKVLELGGNIGRNSLVIAHILKNKNNLVVIECGKSDAKILTENRDLNNFNFHIETSALSKRKLIQKNWRTKPSYILQKGYTWVDTITLRDLKNKYAIKFDTLVLDCEGAFYYILKDTPEILDNINLIIMENDYKYFFQKKYVDRILIKNNFHRSYVESRTFTNYKHKIFERKGKKYLRENFYEVWNK